VIIELDGDGKFLAGGRNWSLRKFSRDFFEKKISAKIFIVGLFSISHSSLRHIVRLSISHSWLSISHRDRFDSSLRHQ
jgi:hypothetical protein